MALAYPGDVSAMSQMMTRYHFLAALDESELEFKIRESESKNLDDAYNRALRLEMIRHGSHRKDQVDSPARRERNVRSIKADVRRSALNDEFQNNLEELQVKNLKQREEIRQENKSNQEELLSQLSQLKPPMTALAQSKDFSQIRCFTCEGMGHTSRICRKRQATGSAGVRLCYECQQPEHLARDCPARRARTTDEAVQGAFVMTNSALRNNSKEAYIELEIGCTTK